MASRTAMLVVVWILMIALIVALMTAIIVAQCHYHRHILKPGQRYIMDGRTYTTPNVEMIGPVRPLKDFYARDLRETIDKSARLLDSLHIEWWLTGGTFAQYTSEMMDLLHVVRKSDCCTKRIVGKHAIYAIRRFVLRSKTTDVLFFR
jgi:hypothetical protein